MRCGGWLSSELNLDVRFDRHRGIVRTHSGAVVGMAYRSSLAGKYAGRLRSSRKQVRRSIGLDAEANAKARQIQERPLAEEKNSLAAGRTRIPFSFFFSPTAFTGGR